MALDSAVIHQALHDSEPPHIRVPPLSIRCPIILPTQHHVAPKDLIPQHKIRRHGVPCSPLRRTHSKTGIPAAGATESGVAGGHGLRVCDAVEGVEEGVGGVGPDVSAAGGGGVIKDGGGAVQFDKGKGVWRASGDREEARSVGMERRLGRNCKARRSEVSRSEKKKKKKQKMKELTTYQSTRQKQRQRRHTV